MCLSINPKCSLEERFIFGFAACEEISLDFLGDSFDVREGELSLFIVLRF